MCSARWAACASATSDSEAVGATRAKWLAIRTVEWPMGRRMWRRVSAWAGAASAVSFGQACTGLPARRTGRASTCASATRQPWASRASRRSITPRCEPRAPAITAGLPASRPSVASAPGRGGKPGAGKTRWLWPVTTASIPSSAATGSAASSCSGWASGAPIPEWQSATTRSQPSARSAARWPAAASAMSRTCSRSPSTARFHTGTCGGRRPSTPIRRRCGCPASSIISRSRIAAGGSSVRSAAGSAPSVSNALLETTGQVASASVRSR